MKKSIALLTLMALMAGSLFAQEEVIEEQERRPMNTITVDFGPTIIGSLGGGIIGSMLGNGGGFGIAAQYERQLFRIFSVGGRFEYIWMGMSFYEVSADFNTFSIEGHARLYPFGGTFFLDALLGYANYKAEISASASGISHTMDSESNYFKFGGKLGWRIDFGRPGGFVFEPAFSYNAILGNGSNFESISTGVEEADAALDDIFGSLNMMNDVLANYIFVGGPKINLSFGWRF
jgi:hypothetical protein